MKMKLYKPLQSDRTVLFYTDCFSAVFQILISVCAYHYPRILYYEKVNVMPGYCVIGVSRIPRVMHFHNYKPHKAKFKRRGLKRKP